MEKGGVRGGGRGREGGDRPKFNELIIGGYVWHWGRGGRVIATEAIPMKGKHYNMTF